ncbi:MAG: DNA translocase FtsK 4TM domain-containing protein, partial [Gammaproteobacteria bacterium]|nr:DNA translocase FtsK 4TM domain-containing protein [Gammaproteobacteria bacterium]
MTDHQPNVLNGFQRLLEVGLILAGTIALYILITLFTFDPADPSWSKTGNYELIKNAGGAFGAWLADILLFTFGWLAFFVPVSIALIGWLLFRKFHNLIEIDYLALGLRLIGIIFFVVGASAISSVNFNDIYYFSSGGIIGDVISYLVMPLFGFAGSTLIMLVFVIVGTTLMTGVSWMTIIDGIGRYTILTCQYVYKKLTANRHKEQRANEPNSNALFGEKPSSPTSPLETSSDIAPETLQPIDNESVSTQNEDAKSKSLLNQFFGSAEDKNDSVQPELDKKEPVIDLQDSQAAGMVEQGISPEVTSIEQSNSDTQNQTQHSQTARDISLDDDMPFSIEDLEQASYSSLDEQISEDDIQGALSSMQSAQQTTPQRSTEAVESAVLTPEPKKPSVPVTLPALDLLDRPDKVENPVSQEELDAVSRLVEAKLLDFNIQANVVGVYPGPVITRFELDLAPGIKVSKITGLSKDLARSLSAMSVRVVEVIPGKSYIGLEIPNKHRLVVRLSEVMDTPAFKNSQSPTTMVLGKDIAGKAVVVDLAKMPHLLVAGTTGSGKSVGVNTMILSLLYKSTPEEVRMIMIDPKMLELSVYEGIPHLLSEVVTDMKEAANALRWCVGEMERRYKLMSALGVRNLKGYNAKIAKGIAEGKPVRDPLWRATDNMLEMPPELEKLPAIVVVIDEFADMMMIVG